jgi:hypothetical protein
VRHATGSAFKGVKVGQVAKSRRYSSKPHDLSVAGAKRRTCPLGFARWVQQNKNTQGGSGKNLAKHAVPLAPSALRASLGSIGGPIPKRQRLTRLAMVLGHHGVHSREDDRRGAQGSGARLPSPVLSERWRVRPSVAIHHLIRRSPCVNTSTLMMTKSNDCPSFYGLTALLSTPLAVPKSLKSGNEGATEFNAVSSTVARSRGPFCSL